MVGRRGMGPVYGAASHRKEGAQGTNGSVAAATRAPDTRPMFDAIPMLLLTAALVDGAVLYAVLVARRVHERRVQERLQDTAHLYSVVRTTLADRRAA